MIHKLYNIVLYWVKYYIYLKTISEYDIQTFIILYQNIVAGKIRTPSQNMIHQLYNIVLYPVKYLFIYLKTISEYDTQTFIILYPNIVSGKILYIYEHHLRI